MKRDAKTWYRITRCGMSNAPIPALAKIAKPQPTTRRGKSALMRLGGTMCCIAGVNVGRKYPTAASCAPGEGKGRPRRYLLTANPPKIIYTPIRTSRQPFLLHRPHVPTRFPSGCSTGGTNTRGKIFAPEGYKSFLLLLHHFSPSLLADPSTFPTSTCGLTDGQTLVIRMCGGRLFERERGKSRVEMHLLEEP